MKTSIHVWLLVVLLLFDVTQGFLPPPLPLVTKKQLTNSADCKDEKIHIPATPIVMQASPLNPTISLKRRSFRRYTKTLSLSLMLMWSPRARPQSFENFPRIFCGPAPAIAKTIPFEDASAAPPVNLSMKRRGRVMDLCKVISKEDKRTILSTIEDVEAETGAELQVVVVDSIHGGLTTKQFATRIFNKWGIGPGDKNNGALVLVSLNDRRIEIEIGEGLNPYMGELWSRPMLEDYSIPHFRKGGYSKGILNAVERAAERMKDVDGGVSHSAGGSRFRAVDGILIAGYLGAYLKDPVGEKLRKCEKCGSRGGLDIGREGVEDLYWKERWKEEVAATNFTAGVESCAYFCRKCGGVGKVKRAIPKYDYSEVDGYGVRGYYRNTKRRRGGERGGRGGSSSGGGGGGGW